MYFILTYVARKAEHSGEVRVHVKLCENIPAKMDIFIACAVRASDAPLRNVCFSGIFETPARLMHQRERFTSPGVSARQLRKVPSGFVPISNYIREKVSGLASRGDEVQV